MSNTVGEQGKASTEYVNTIGTSMPVVKVALCEPFPEVKGVFVEGCVSRGDGSSFRAMAHAHTKGTYEGWICVRSRKRLTQKRIMLHEVAHILTGVGHTDKWRKKVREIGGVLEYWETKEFFQLRRAGIHIRKRVGKREAKRLLTQYGKR